MDLSDQKRWKNFLKYQKLQPKKLQKIQPNQNKNPKLGFFYKLFASFLRIPFCKSSTSKNKL